MKYGELPFFIGTRFDVKKVWNRLVFVQKFERNLPLISKGGMVRIFCYIKNGLILSSMF